MGADRKGANIKANKLLCRACLIIDVAKLPQYVHIAVTPFLSHPAVAIRSEKRRS